MTQVKMSKKGYSKPAQKKKVTNKELSKRITRLEHSDELKHVVRGVAQGTVSGTGDYYLLNGISTGDDHDNRVGQEICAKYLNVQMHIINPLASTATVKYRILLVWDKQCNGAAPQLLTSVSDDAVLDDSTTSLISQDWLSPHNYAAKERYVILMDKSVALNPSSDTKNNDYLIKKNFNLHGAICKYTGTSSAVTDIVTRSLGILIYRDGSPTATFGFVSRFWYTDS